jgi:hypothetical protein
MRDTEQEDEPDDTLLAEAGEQFDFSPLHHADLRAIPVRCSRVAGLTLVRRGEAPLADTLGQSCGDPQCRYRAHAVTLHASRHALLDGIAERAAACEAPLELVIEQLAVDVYRLRSPAPVRLIELQHHPIRQQLALSAEGLDGCAIESPQWALVRALRDLYETRVVRLAREQGAQRLLVHADLAAQLEVCRLGTLAEVLPILPAGLGSGSLAGALARRLRRNTTDR